MHPVARIIDANANRAREALRVLEDIARFALDDAELSASLKSLRHDLRAALDGLSIDKAVLLSSRDTEGDVGTAITTPAEYARTGLRDVALAAASRLTEALRSIEEAAKAIPASSTSAINPAKTPAAAFESLRYRAYSVEKSLILKLRDTTCPQWRLCVLITRSLCVHHDWLEVARRAIDGGADCVQLREKSLDGVPLLDAARRLVELARPRRVHVVINDRSDIALLSGADGVHLGQTDLSVADVRQLAGFRLLVGVSTGTIQQAHAAANSGADSCGVGPMFPTTTKEKPIISGPAYLREYLRDPRSSPLPHLAIGGITPANIHELVAVGCRGVAVSSVVCGAHDPAQVCRQLLDALPRL